MKSATRISLYLVLLAGGLLQLRASEPVAAPVTIAGDFVRDRGDVQYTFHDLVQTPIEVPWHKGLSVREALRLAGVRPRFHPIKVHTGDRSFSLKFPFPAPADHSDADTELRPGSTITFYALDF